MNPKYYIGGVNLKENCCVILAAGDGKRMKSDRPKVLSPVLFKPMLHWVIDAARETGLSDMCVVTGYQHELIETYLEKLDGEFETAVQAERRGTGHAVMTAQEYLKRHSGGNVLILCGDAPFVDSATIQNAFELHRDGGNAVTVISSEIDDPAGYGRIVRSSSDRSVKAIIEEKDADEKTRGIHEVNSGAYWFRTDDLLAVLGLITINNEQEEYYLTEAVSLLIGQGKPVNAYVTENRDTVLGANSCAQLHKLGDRARMARLYALLEEGVEMPCLDGIIVGPDVTVQSGTVLLPGTILRGNTTIGSGCVLGPNTIVENSTVGDRVALNSVQCYQSIVEDEVTVGPFVHIRPNSTLKKGVKIGDFVEVKNSVVGVGTKVPHLTYVGDSDVGAGVNFGCGCVTVNYDGVNKARCKVGDHAFIGCNTNLIAPVEVGNYAYTAAGSTITEAVPVDALAIARARQLNKEGWVVKTGRKK